MNANHYNYTHKKKGKFYRVVNIIVMTAFLFNMSATQGLLMLSPATAEATTVDKYTLCHATSSESNPWVRINVPMSALSAHLDEHGTPLAGHDDDVFLGLDNANTLQCPTPPLFCPNVFADDFSSYTVNQNITAPWSQQNGAEVKNAGGGHGKVVEMQSSNSHDEEAIWTTINTSGRTNLKLQYDHKTTGLEGYQSDIFTVKYKANGEASWHILYDSDDNDDWDHKTHNLPDANQITIRFGLDGTSDDDKAFVDNVSLSGCVANICGDGTVGGDEQCDDGSNNGEACTPEYGSSCEYCSANCTVETVEGGFCGDDVINGREQCDDGNTEDGDGCSANCTEEPVTIVAHKIVCTDETDLPNWGNGGENITADTAQTWVNEHESCELVSDWDFQWRVDGANPYNPGDNTGESVDTDWTTFGPTDGNGMTSVAIDADMADRLWFREVWQDGYIPFTYNINGNNSDNVSAEFYCNNDVLNYDNLEWIDNMQAGETYNCVAWNVLEEEPTYDLHGYKWNDLNGNGYRECEPVKGSELTTVATPPLECEPKLSGWTVFIDENENGILDGEEISTVTSSETEHFGWYWFEDLPAGDYRVCEVQQDGWSQTYPSDNACHMVTLPETDITGLTMSLNAVEGYEYNFGNEHDKGDLTIVKYDDDQNLMAEVEFQIDGETYWTNGNGEIMLEDVLTGYHIVQEMGTEGYTFTSVSGENCTNSNPSAANVLEDTTTTCTFTNTRDTGELTGLKYNDLNGNGVRDCEIPAKGMTMINGPVDDPECEPVLSGWTINIALNTCSENESDYDLHDDDVLNLSDLGVFAQYLGEGNVMGDMNNDGVTDQADFTCFSAMYSDEPFPSVPDMSDVTDENGNYEFTGLIPGSYNIWETQDQMGWMQTSSPEVYTILITAGMEVSEVDFGNQYIGYCGDGIVNGEEMCDGEAGDIPENYSCTQICTINEDLHSTISGYKYEDLNGNGAWDEFEQPLNDWEICQVFDPSEIGEVGIAGITSNTFKQGISLDEIPEDEGNCVLTGSGDWPDGYYEFKFYRPGHVSVTETMQNGYVKTQPVEASYEIEAVEPTDYADYRFGNQPDFSVDIEKSASVSVIGQSEQFSYTVDWEMLGIITADEVVITDTLPADVTFVSATDSGVYDNGTHTVTWTLNDVAPGTTGSFGITVETASNVTNGEELVNTVEILATKYLDVPAEATALDDPILTRIDRSDTANATVTVVVNNPLLQITKDANVTDADPGDTVTYTVVVANIGTATALNVMVDDTLPAGMTFVNGGGTTVTMVLGDIIAGQSVTETYDVIIADGATTGSYENLAVAYADNHGEVSDSAIIDVEAPIVLGETTEAELALTKSANVAFTNPGGTVEYTLTLANDGTEDAQNVVLTDQLPDGFVFEGTTESTKVWNFSTIAMGSSETVTYKATAQNGIADGKYENVATATADNTENVSASASVEVRAVSVLGELVDTGTSARDYILYVAGIMLVVSGIWFTTRGRKLSHHSK